MTAANTWPSRAQVPPCSACEADLRLVEGKWLCCRPGCPLYGREQLAVPDAAPRDKAERREE